MDRLGRIAALAAAAAAAAGCAENHGSPGGPEERARQLAQELLVVDTHIDVPYRLRERMEDISVRTEGGHFDYPRARAGGLDVAFMSIYVPASYQESGGAREIADALIDMVEKFEVDWPEKFAVVRSPDEARRVVASGRIALPLGMENGAGIEDDLANLEHFRDRGIAYITLTHAENNRISDSSFAEDRTWGGLSPFGRRVVEEMNRLGVMVDISHVSDEAFWQVLGLTRAPVIASHSSCRAMTPGWERNMDDAMIEALAGNGGVIQINFGSAFVHAEANRQSLAFWKAYGEQGLEPGSDEARTFRERYWSERERITGSVEDVADHIDRVVRLAGIDHVGLGSDFDGVFTVPRGLEDVSAYPNLIRVLLERGYGEDDLRKICGENLMRVWSEVERIAGAARD